MARPMETADDFGETVRRCSDAALIVHGILSVMPWAIHLYEDDDGCPVRCFLDTLEEPRRAKLLAVIQLLGEKGPTLPFPYSSQLRHKLRELRTSHGAEQYRVLYFGNANRRFVLLHALRKHSAQLPQRDVAIAQARMESYARAKRDDRRGNL